jgi:D-alanyl-lipoteichoic acid acyltransferase DltB (MBOAT superfamily)
MALIVLGLFRKVLIGDAAGRFVDNLFGQPELYRSPELLAGLFLFSIQVYADFSGYSDIARGVAKLFGVELMKNFEQPYFARSFSEFWRRWHISLSSWIWDYVFNPLMSALLRRVSRWNLPSPQHEMRLVYPVAAVATMVLCGLWHGAGIAFLVWGAIHGVCLAVERLAYGSKAIPMRPKARNLRAGVRLTLGWFSTQSVVVFAWLLFRTGSLDAAGDYLRHIVHWESSELAGRFLGAVLWFGTVLLALDAAEYATQGHAFLLRLRPPVAVGISAAVLVVVVLYMATTKPMPFVYFQF